MAEEGPVFFSPSSLLPSSNNLRCWDRLKKPWAWCWLCSYGPHISPNDYKVQNKDATTFKRRLGNTLSLWANGKMGIHANQVVWVEDGEAFVIVWDSSCQHVSASGWILGSGFCRPLSFLSKHALSKICFRFLENPKLKPKWASSGQFCVQITDIQVVFLSTILYFSENLRSFSFPFFF